MITRRQFATHVGLATAGLALQTQPAEANRWQRGRSPWPLCLDTATIQPQSLEDKIRLAAKHGFDGLEPWDRELSDYEKQGGSLDDLGKRIRDAGLFVPSVIGLWKALPATDGEFEPRFGARHRFPGTVFTLRDAGRRVERRSGGGSPAHDPDSWEA